MIFSKEILDAARLAAAKHPNSIDQAVEQAEQTIRSLDDFDDFVDALVRSTIRDLVHAARHQTNVRIRNQEGSYGQPAKVVVGSSAAVAAVCERYLDYCIAGRTLGQIKGEELQAIADGERANASTHVFNAMLCEKLATRLRPLQRVADVYSEKKLAALFAEVRAGLKTEVA